MVAKTRFRTITKRTRALLDRQEDRLVEWKEKLSAIDPKDLIAFANSESGGTILVGIKEVTSEDGTQRPEVVGCSVGDKSKLTIVNKAQACFPPVPVQVYIENEAQNPFFRVEVPSGPDKPYCTARGAYLIRGDARNEPIFPATLLTMFASSDSKQFVERYRKATGHLEDAIQQMTSESLEQIANLEHVLAGFEGFMSQGVDRIEEDLGAIFHLTDSAGDAATDAQGSVDEAIMKITEVEQDLRDVSENVTRIDGLVNAVMDHLEIPEPEPERFKFFFQAEARQHIADKGEEGLEELVRAYETKRRIREEILRPWADEALKDAGE